jgi:hypothetical protein
LTVGAQVADQGKAVSMPVAGIPPARKKVPAVHAGPCIPRVPARVALQVRVAVRPSALRDRGLAPVLALVRLGRVEVALAWLRHRVRLRARREQPRSSVVDASSTRRPKRAR